jgi:hypothetical protein
LLRDDGGRAAGLGVGGETGTVGLGAWAGDEEVAWADLPRVFVDAPNLNVRGMV